MSYDGKEFTTIFTINSMVHSGWNFEVPENPIGNIKLFRFYDSEGSLNSGCKLAELKLYGWIFYNQDIAITDKKACTAKISVNGVIPSNAIDAVVYSNSVTPVVNTVTPIFGSSYGNTAVTIVG